MQIKGEDVALLKGLSQGQFSHSLINFPFQNGPQAIYIFLKIWEVPRHI